LSWSTANESGDVGFLCELKGANAAVERNSRA
jgi:hypothetical protein